MDKELIKLIQNGFDDIEDCLITLKQKQEELKDKIKILENTDVDSEKLIQRCDFTIDTLNTMMDKVKEFKNRVDDNFKD